MPICDSWLADYSEDIFVDIKTTHLETCSSDPFSRHAWSMIFKLSPITNYVSKDIIVFEAWYRNQNK